MSTRNSIKYGDGYHVFTEMTDHMCGVPEDQIPIYIEVACSSIELSVDEDTRLATIELPRDIAKSLGLI